MRAVSNTSPISNLAIVGRLGLLQRRYGVVRIPPTVAAELAALSHPEGKKRVDEAVSTGWLLVEKLEVTASRALLFPLDAGETEAIALACHIKADVLLMDERRGREAARHLGLIVAGVLSELVHAKLSGWIPNVHDEILELRRKAGFFVDAEIERFILSQVGE
jgi:predicted nucleic acid-binding protein